MKPAARTVMVKVSFAGRVSLAHPHVHPADTAGGGYVFAVDDVPHAISPGMVVARIASLKLRWPLKVLPRGRRLQWRAVEMLTRGAEVRPCRGTRS